MIHRQIFTKLCPWVGMRSTTRAFHTYRQKPSSRGSYVQDANAQRLAGNTDKNVTTHMTTETPHLAWIGVAGAAASLSICIFWSEIDETRREDIEEMIRMRPEN